jgi:eukaryotic-like serine/threonine-protein kinase
MKYCTVCKAKYEDSVSFCPVDGEVLEDDPSSIVNTVLDGQYQIESLLGRGGMGAVYRARHILLGDRVAIKILPPEVRNNAEWLRRFRREGQAARRFRHPNAVTVYDLRTASDGTIYMVMEYVEGHTLDAELKRRGRFTPAEALDVLEPIMSVLNTAHAMGVVHRDLKPENIMIGKGSNSEERVVKLLDLGIAKMREIAGAESGGTTALTMAGQVLGTPYYMSPEQWGEIPNDGSSEIDGRADIYSLGLVFYEMIAGRRPCSGATLSELRRVHVSVTPTPLDEVVPDVSPAFSSAIARATAKDRADRQATADGLAAELRAAVGKSTTSGLDRTVPDIPRASSSSSNTAGIPAAQQTGSDVNAPTIITIDSAPEGAPATPVTGEQRNGATEKRQPVTTPAPFNLTPQSAESSATVVEKRDLDSSVTIQRPVEQLPVPARQQSKRGPLLFVGATLLVLVVIIVGVGSYFAWSWSTSKPPTGSTVNSDSNSNSKTTTTGVATEFGRYWLELLPVAGDDLRVAGVVPLASGQPFKFHFLLEDDGYVYIIGPGQQNRQTAFLTNKPPAISGVDTNHVRKNIDFSFPSGLEHWLELDKKPGTEDYTIIISREPLSTPAFLAEQATGEPLSDEQQAQLQEFLAKQSPTVPETKVNDASAAEPFVQLKVPQSATRDNPIVFHIRIQHK